MFKPAMPRRAQMCFAVIAACVLFAVAAIAVPAPASAAGWKFVVMSDSQGSGADNTNSVATAMLGEIASYVAANERPDLVVFTGDLTDYTTTQAALESSLNTWKATMAPIYNAGIGVYPLRGSHDLGPNSKESWSDAAWRNVFGSLPGNGPASEQGLTYSFTHNNATFLCLDEWRDNPGTWCTVNTGWVQGQLAANSSPHVFSFTHSQIVKVEHDYCLDTIVPTVRNTLVEALAAGGGRVHFTGHMHVSNFTRLNHDSVDPADASADDDLWQVIVPPASPKYYDWSPETYDGNAIPGWSPHLLDNAEYVNGYTVVEVDGRDVTVTFMRRTGPGAYAADASFSYTAVPEPATASLLALAALAWLRRRTPAAR